MDIGSPCFLAFSFGFPEVSGPIQFTSQTQFPLASELIRGGGRRSFKEMWMQNPANQRGLKSVYLWPHPIAVRRSRRRTSIREREREPGIAACQRPIAISGKGAQPCSRCIDPPLRMFGSTRSLRRTQPALRADRSGSTGAPRPADNCAQPGSFPLKDQITPDPPGAYRSVRGGLSERIPPIDLFARNRLIFWFTIFSSTCFFGI